MKTNNFIYKSILSLMVSMSCVVLHAQQIDGATALNKASRFFSAAKKSPNAEARQRMMTMKKSSYEISYAATSGSDVDYYVVNNSDGGFVIVSGDARTDKQILGYSSTGSFCYDDAPGGLKMLLDNYSTEIQYIRKNVAEVSESAVTDDIQESDHIVVDALVTAKWGQRMPFNKDCGYYAAGCVAIAMGQIMNYWKYPESGRGSNTYYDKYLGTLSRNFEKSTYNWDVILDDYYGHYKDSLNAAEVAKLISDIGVSINMKYGVDTSSALINDAKEALHKNFKYGNTIRKVIYDSSKGVAYWENLIKLELDERRPMIYSGGGHAFVCDGYTDTNLFHFNFGWYNSANDTGAEYNGWYSLTTTDRKVKMYVNPDVLVSILIGIEPPQE